MKKALLIALLALGSISYLSTAQDQEGGQRRGPRAGADAGPGQGQGGPGRGGRGGGPLVGALDANHDGEIDATEIANASKALLTLDKNGDGKLSADELRPAGGPRGGDHGKGPDSQK